MHIICVLSFSISFKCIIIGIMDIYIYIFCDDSIRFVIQSSCIHI